MDKNLHNMTKATLWEHALNELREPEGGEIFRLRKVGCEYRKARTKYLQELYRVFGVAEVITDCVRMYRFKTGEDMPQEDIDALRKDLEKCLMLNYD